MTHRPPAFSPLRRGLTVAASFALLSALLLGAGCEREVPAPWKEMYLPLDNSEILPGSDATRLNVKYKVSGPIDAYLREYQSALEKAGWVYHADGKNHDPAANTHSLILRKGGNKLRLTLQGGPRLRVEIKTIDD